MKMALPSGARGYFCFYFFIFSCMLIQLPQISLQLLSCLRIYTSERHFISLINLFSWLPRLGWNAAPLKLTFITTRRTAPGPPRSPTFSSTGAGPCLYFSAYIRMWCQHGISDGPLPSSPPRSILGRGRTLLVWETVTFEPRHRQLYSNPWHFQIPKLKSSLSGRESRPLLYFCRLGQFSNRPPPISTFDTDVCALPRAADCNLYGNGTC